MFIESMTDKLAGNLIGKTKRRKQKPNARIFLPVTEATGQSLMYKTPTHALYVQHYIILTC